LNAHLFASENTFIYTLALNEHFETWPKVSMCYYRQKGFFVDNKKREVKTLKVICTLCNYILEEAAGLPQAGIKPGTKFDNLPNDWKCPDCAASKEFFQTCSCVSLPIFEATKVANTHKCVDAA